MYVRSKRPDRKDKGCGRKQSNIDLALHKQVRVVLGIFSCSVFHRKLLDLAIPKIPVKVLRRRYRVYAGRQMT